MMRLILAIAVALLAASLVATPAPAQEPGVHVDPDSPTGQEYDIPLERARRENSASEDESRRSSRSPAETLFGAGIEPGDGDPGGEAAAQPSAAAPTGGASPEPGARGSGRRSLRSGAASIPPSVEAAVRNPGAPADRATPALLFGGLAILLLGAGIAGGLALRRRS